MRDVILMPALAELLREHRKESTFDRPDDYVFTTRNGTPEHAAHLGIRVLKPALESAGLQPIRWHDLRHTFASLLIAGGANITFVSRQLGHTSSQVTLGVYAHLLDREEQARRTREMLETTLGEVVRRDGRWGGAENGTSEAPIEPGSYGPVPGAVLAEAQAEPEKL